MADREQQQLPPNWPFETGEERDQYEDLQRRGYAHLRAAHDLYSEAYARLHGNKSQGDGHA